MEWIFIIAVLIVVFAIFETIDQRKRKKSMDTIQTMRPAGISWLRIMVALLVVVGMVVLLTYLYSDPDVQKEMKGVSQLPCYGPRTLHGV